ncbi:MAG: NAD(P)H-dependent oxidoreductase [Pseudomonadota bacterium]
MSTLNAQHIIASLNWRYATKAFDHTQSIPDEDWQAIKESLRLSASSFGLQPWKFIEVDSQKVKDRLAECVKLNAPKILTSSKLMVVAGLKQLTQDYIEHYIKDVMHTRDLNEAEIQDFKSMITATASKKSLQEQAFWASRQAYIALGSAITTAALLRIDSCPMEGINRETYDEVLALKDSNYTSLVAIAFGYRADTDKNQQAKKVRFSESEIFKKA